MNLVMLFKEDFVDEDTVEVMGRRHKHILEIHKAEPGKKLTVGLLNEKMGTGEILKIDDELVRMKVCLEEDPPEPAKIEIVMAMPRPKVFKRIIQDLTTMGVKNIYIIKTWKVEKSFWNSPKLNEKSLKEAIVLGLEQGKDTIMPNIKIFKRFRPFIEDEIPGIIIGKKAIVAHPISDKSRIETDEKDQSIVLAIGPEGGFIDYEVEMFKRYGFECISLGDRILRVETVLPYLIGRLS